MEAEMPFFDTDAHVYEGAEVFSDRYLDPPYRDRRPQIVAVGDRPYWMIDSQLLPRWTGRAPYILGTPVACGSTWLPAAALAGGSRESMELASAAERYPDMDREDIDTQVIYPSLMMASLSADPLFAAALNRSYNRWLVDVLSGQDRVKWVAYVTLDDVPSAVAEVREAKRNGAVGVCILGTVGDRTLDRPEFLPFFEAAAEEDLTVVVHVGHSFPALHNLYDNHLFAMGLAFTLPLLLGFAAITGGGLLDRLPTLRVGFLEAGCLWVHFLLDRLEHRFNFGHRLAEAMGAVPPPPMKRHPIEYLRSGRLFVNAEVEDPLLPEVVELIGTDHVVLGSDMPHGDREPFAARDFRARTDLSEAVKQKILWDNGFRFYGLPVPNGGGTAASNR
jgi:predicted TIM-barrel fold metal-dependent hydrolase